MPINNLKGSDSAPSLCLNFGLLAPGQPDSDLQMFKFMSKMEEMPSSTCESWVLKVEEVFDLWEE